MINNYYAGTPSRKKKRNAMFYIRHIARILMGLLFIFSSYVKMVDPFGFSLKISEYFISFGLDFFTPMSMFCAFCALLAEALIGWALLLNIQMKITSWLLLIFMLFFTLLTFWLAFATNIVNAINHIFKTNYEIFVVTDCGCFGDFIKLTNHQTFFKNVIFLLFTLIIFYQRKNYEDQKWYYLSQWGPIIVIGLCSIFIMTYCLLHEPWHDFRPWKVGNFIAAETYSVVPEMDFVFQYKNDSTGQIKELTIDQLSEIADDSLANADLENNYSFISRREKMISPGINARLADFSITNNEEGRDIKNEVINATDYHFLIFIRNLENLNERKLSKVKALINKCEEENIDFTILTSTSPDIADNIKEELELDYDMYFCDATPMKTALRNDPGVALLKDGYVIDKWAFRDIPKFESFKEAFEKYDAKLQKYIKKNPPILPNGVNLVTEEDEAETEETGEETETLE